MDTKEIAKTIFEMSDDFDHWEMMDYLFDHDMTEEEYINIIIADIESGKSEQIRPYIEWIEYAIKPEEFMTAGENDFILQYGIIGENIISELLKRIQS